MISKIRKRLKKANSQKGFTLLEILVVLTIMGFLIAMVAPRLAGISGSAVDTVCDTNQNRMTTFMSSFFEQTNSMPTKLTNLVEETDDGEYQIPAVSDGDPDNGAETLAAEFMGRNHFRIHYLNDAEAEELRGLGVTTVLNLNAYDAYNDAGDAYKADYPATDTVAGTLGVENPNDVDLAAEVTKAPRMEEMPVPTDTTATPIAVAMVGMGAANNDDAPTFDVELGERDWGEPDWFGRIVLGFGPENSIITSGIVANAAHCPGGIQNADNVTYNDYNLVLPRLAATGARMTAADATLTGFTADPEALNAVAYDEEPAAGYVLADNDDNLKYRTFNITKAQDPWQYVTQCPEGHMYPADDEEFWGIDIAGTVGNID
jgi:prepilin-type N-terminal cleavage/methylation domain-containing protein